jgi:hypothetical protein
MNNSPGQNDDTADRGRGATPAKCRLSSSNRLPKIAAARKNEPAKLSRLVRGEIDWIVMKCLEGPIAAL